MASESEKYFLHNIDCQLNTLHGLVHVAYTRDERDTVANAIRLRLTIPTNTQARVIYEALFLGARYVRFIEGDKLIWSSSTKSSTEKHNIAHEAETGLMIVHIGSGQYEYQAYWEQNIRSIIVLIVTFSSTSFCLNNLLRNKYMHLKN